MTHQIKCKSEFTFLKLYSLCLMMSNKYSQKKNNLPPQLFNKNALNRKNGTTLFHHHSVQFWWIEPYIQFHHFHMWCPTNPFNNILNLSQFYFIFLFYLIERLPRLKFPSLIHHVFVNWAPKTEFFHSSFTWEWLINDTH